MSAQIEAMVLAMGSGAPYFLHPPLFSCPSAPGMLASVLFLEVPGMLLPQDL